MGSLGRIGAGGRSRVGGVDFRGRHACQDPIPLSHRTCWGISLRSLNLCQLTNPKRPLEIRQLFGERNKDMYLLFSPGLVSPCEKKGYYIYTIETNA